MLSVFLDRSIDALCGGPTECAHIILFGLGKAPREEKLANCSVLSICDGSYFVSSRPPALSRFSIGCGHRGISTTIRTPSLLFHRYQGFRAFRLCLEPTICVHSCLLSHYPWAERRLFTLYPYLIPVQHFWWPAWRLRRLCPPHDCPRNPPPARQNLKKLPTGNHTVAAGKASAHSRTNWG